MGRRSVLAIVTSLLAPVAGAGAGCGSDGHHTNADGASQDADFSVCVDTPAVMYAPGISVTSASGAYTVTLVSAMTAGPPPAPTPEVGTGIWVVTIADVATGAPAADVTLTADRPWMPRHGHGATEDPVVTPGDPGVFTISNLKFFMSGYWELKLHVTPTGGAADDAIFSICIPG